jgi:hypothetical protein
MWKSLVNGLILISGLTNCLLFGFSSNQLRVLVPQLYRKSPRITASVDEVLVEGERGWIIVFIIFGLERMLIMVGRLVRAMFAEIPEDVWKELERRQRLHEEERRMLRERSRNEAPIPKNRCRNRWMIAR